jgi:hypothetical protein
MQVTQERLQTIILEEYLMEEGILDEEMSDERKKEMIDWIKGRGPRPEWANKDLGTSRQGKSVQSPMDPNVDRAADTMPFPADDASPDDKPEPEASSEVHPIKATIDSIYELVSDMDPEDVQEIFQIVFEKLPGVELEPAPENPGTLYTPGSEGRPQVGFKLEELKQLIRRVLRDV